jgi:RNA polymerase sigma-70 factor, ECF subfamily
MTADVVNLEAHRPALTGHCYRMLGSVFDADDAVQETLIRAWRAWDQFDRQTGPCTTNFSDIEIPFT